MGICKTEKMKIAPIVEIDLYYVLQTCEKGKYSSECPECSNEYQRLGYTLVMSLLIGQSCELQLGVVEYLTLAVSPLKIEHLTLLSRIQYG